ncbi:MAG: dihydropteroate synthase [Nitrospirae bacterium]|nr:dihydropteroate synthase [Nitrospirota bacterium]
MTTVATRQPASERLVCASGRILEFERTPLVMGVLNLTPDSFSDGGLWMDPPRALARAEEMVAQGADLLDLGAESTRPGGGVYGTGAQGVPAEEELNRLLPVLEPLRELVSVPLSVDTRKSTVARVALEAGADLINDISCLADPELAVVAAEWGSPLILMHSRGDLASMQRQIHFDDVVEDVIQELGEAADRACDRGVSRDKIVIDPGIGFGKNGPQILELLRRLGELQRLDLPILVGASRKSFIGAITDQPADARLAGSLATIGWAASQGAAMVRVHDVAETVQFLEVWESIDTAGGLQ